MSKKKEKTHEQVLAHLEKNGFIGIHALRFPCYKNLARDEEIRFTFPVTVLLGPNGTNKSSILHALYGAPAGQSLADYWFETKMDHIPAEIDGRKQSVVHAYMNGAGNSVECIKARAPRRDDPDYWEAVKPTKAYGMSTTVRVSPVRLGVTHLDFRGELTAYDKYFYFPDEQHLARLEKAPRVGQLRRTYRKQNYLRNRSRHVMKLFEGVDPQCET